MEFKVKKSEFLKGLYLAQSIADRKSTMPVLANTLIRSEGKDAIMCAATDLRITVVAEVKAEVLKEGGMSLPSSKFFEIVKNLPGDEVVLKRQENNRAEIKSGKANFQLLGMSDRDFPRLPDHKAVKFKEIDAALLSEMIGKTIFSVSTDETRRHSSGIYLEWQGATLRMVSTDGHRLSKAEQEVGEGLSIEEGIIVPRKGVMEIRRLVEGIEGTCELGLHEGNLFVHASDVMLAIKLVDAQFPPYRQVIPKENKKKVLVDRSLFLEALTRVSIMSADKNGGIRLDLSNNCLRIISDNPDLGEAQEDLDVKYSGENLAIGFNARYFIDILKEMKDDQVQLEFNGNLDPGMVRTEKNESYMGVIMPMRLYSN